MERYVDLWRVPFDVLSEAPWHAQGHGPAHIWRQEVEKRVNDLLDRAMSLITALDCMEADWDLVDTADDEPSSGWGHRGGQSFLVWHRAYPGPRSTCDLELDSCDDEDGGDLEGTARETTAKPSCGPTTWNRRECS
ncbi:hypothetical protein OOJ09_11285 [Mesorhizobium qingshengii]|uniref:Uncharacterized protein n=1 Tax=Mesorhizobium qingshengii TaxID=1165689 RepID=A0ABT4QTP1_9HYPH|nr:hypothetical protein [Mesorhizobium qingshengii]MCZ8544768.1 hypothetical protein [Mesorhizobium qingshengii]